MKRYYSWVPAMMVGLISNMSHAGPQCFEDIELINGSGCYSPCCTQEPANSGHYSFPHVSVEKIDIRGNPSNVKSVSFPKLRSVEQDVRISYNQDNAITRISFPSLRRAGSIDIVRNPGLVDINLPVLFAVNGSDYDASLLIQSNPALQSFNAPLLKSVIASEAGTAFIDFAHNTALQHIILPNLSSVESTNDEYGEAYIYIGNNDRLRTVSMDSLQRLEAGEHSISYLIVDDLPQLETISFPRLKELLPTGLEDNFSELTIGHSPKLTNVDFPSLERVTVLQLTGLQGTRSVQFPKMAELDYLWAFRNCANQDSTMKMYICNDDQAIGDFHLSDSDGFCGMAGYKLYSPNMDDLVACESTGICQSFEPDPSEFVCRAR